LSQDLNSIISPSKHLRDANYASTPNLQNSNINNNLSGSYAAAAAQAETNNNGNNTAPPERENST
jgi:hypothetical protein